MCVCVCVLYGLFDDGVRMGEERIEKQKNVIRKSETKASHYPSIRHQSKVYRVSKRTHTHTQYADTLRNHETKRNGEQSKDIIRLRCTTHIRLLPFSLQVQVSIESIEVQKVQGTQYTHALNGYKYISFAKQSPQSDNTMRYDARYSPNPRIRRNKKKKHFVFTIGENEII